MSTDLEQTLPLGEPHPLRRSPPPKARLTCINPASLNRGSRSEIPLEESEITLGRSDKNSVVLDLDGISRTHALVKRRDDGSFLMLDAGSSNGTLVNGQNVLVRGHGSATPIKPGDNVRLGAVDFTFVDASGLRDYAAMMD